MVYEEEYRNYFKGDDRFQLSTLTIPVQSQGMGVFFMKGNTDLKQFIDHEITDILESGISDSWNSENYNLAIEWEIIDD